LAFKAKNTIADHLKAKEPKKLHTIAVASSNMLVKVAPKIKLVGPGVLLKLVTESIYRPDRLMDPIQNTHRISLKLDIPIAQ
jgi:hypothetical protein